MGSIEQPFVLEILKLDNVFTVMGYFPEASELLPNPNAVEEDAQLVRRCRGIYELPGQVDADFGPRRGLAVGHRKLSGLEHSTLSLDAFKQAWTDMSPIEKDRSIIVVYVNNNHYWYFRPAEDKQCASPDVSTLKTEFQKLVDMQASSRGTLLSNRARESERLIRKELQLHELLRIWRVKARAPLPALRDDKDVLFPLTRIGRTVTSERRAAMETARQLILDAANDAQKLLDLLDDKDDAVIVETIRIARTSLAEPRVGEETRAEEERAEGAGSSGRPGSSKDPLPPKGPPGGSGSKEQPGGSGSDSGPPKKRGRINGPPQNDASAYSHLIPQLPSHGQAPAFGGMFGSIDNLAATRQEEGFHGWSRQFNLGAEQHLTEYDVWNTQWDDLLPWIQQLLAHRGMTHAMWDGGNFKDWDETYRSAVSIALTRLVASQHVTTLTSLHLPFVMHRS